MGGRVSRAWKGALWSGLVLPGLGQIVLKHYLRGLVLLLVFSASLLAFVNEAMRQASALLDKMMTQGGALDMDAIEKAAASESLVFNLLGLLMIGCWVVGVVDAYRIGRKMDEEERLASGHSSRGPVRP